MEESLNDNLTKCEGKVAILRQLADFMLQKKFAKSKEHIDEVKVLENEVEEWWKTTTAAAHTRSIKAAAAIATPPAAARRPPPPHVEGTSTAGDLRVWRKKFESY